MYGQSGADTFVFDTRPDKFGDYIGDFQPGTDVIELNSEIFGGVDNGVLDRQAFKSIKGIAFKDRIDADDRASAGLVAEC